MEQVNTESAAKAAGSTSASHFGARLAHWQDYAKDGLAAIKHDLSEVRQTAHNIRVRGGVRSFLQKMGVMGQGDAEAMPPEQAAASRERGLGREESGMGSAREASPSAAAQEMAAQEIVARGREREREPEKGREPEKTSRPDEAP